jgi:hypothetical protein
MPAFYYFPALFDAMATVAAARRRLLKLESDRKKGEPLVILMR